ncbi:MAG: aminotransferase class I/II-fold pyridoxal phosphate-dependent enzyme [Vicinamibacterales bacterium]
MEARCQDGRDRRAFLTRAGVLALAPLAARISAEAATSAPTRGGKFDFDTPFGRIGTDSVKWDMPMRQYDMQHLVAGLGVADMDFRCAPVITKALEERVAFPNWGYNLLDFDLFLGTAADRPFVRDIVEWNRRHYGINVIEPKQLGVSPGVIPGIVYALKAFAPEGSKVLMVTPSYVGFYAALGFTKTVAEESLMKRVNGRYEIDWDDFEHRMTSDVKVSILCNPHNPTGRVWSREELVRYGELCRKHNVIVLSDEIHCDFLNEGQSYVPFSTLPKELVDNSITFKSGSKSFSLASHKCAWFYSTNPALFEATNAQAFPVISNTAFVAEQAALAGGDEWLRECVAYINGNLHFTHRYVKEHLPQLDIGAEPEGTYLMWLDASKVADRIDANKSVAEANAKPPALDPFTKKPILVTRADIVSEWFAKHADVFLESGSGFGKGGENYLRLNVATSRITLKAALDSLASALKTLG